LADRDNQVEDVRQSEAERNQRISAAEAELLALKDSRLFRLHSALAEPWSLRKLTHLRHFTASLVSPKWARRGVSRFGPGSQRGTNAATPAGGEERFDPDLYRELYPDIDASGSDPHEHYAVFGRREGRIGWLDTTLDLSGLEKGRPTAVVVFHEGSRTGAPVLGYNLVRRLLPHGNVVAFFYRPGPMMVACRKAGAVVLGPELWRGLPFPLPTNLSRRFIEQIAPQFAILNSVESRHIVRSLADLYVPTISLIHEFSANTHPRGAMADAAFWSGATVFSAEIVRDNARASDLDLSDIDFPVIAQGRCDLPDEDRRDRRSREEEAELITRALRPPDFPSDGIVVLAVGSVIPRKGVDLFIECATRVREFAPDLHVRFVWIGSTNPVADPAYSAVLGDQIRRAEVSGTVAILDEVPALLPAYQSADMLLVTSRLDPLPNVAIDALYEGLPVLCFDRTTGIAEILKQNGLGDACIASYLSPEAMARKVIELATAAESRERIGAQSARLAAATFDMDRYVSRLQDLVEQERSRADREHRDADIIATSGVLRVDFLRRPEERHEAYTDTVRRYVRAWSSGIRRRKPFPGFHPAIYLDEHGVQSEGTDPLVDYLRAGRPPGPWDLALVTPGDSPPAAPPSLRIGLHIHVHYPDLLATMLERLERNQTHIDLLVSATSDEAARAATAQLAGYQGGSVDVRIVPNRGRDIAPLLTEFAGTIVGNYDIVGHVHTKKTADLTDGRIGEEWYRFLLENLVGGRAHMADEILSRMAAEPNVGMVFPDDPHVVGWTGNRAGARELGARLGLGKLPENPVFPVGSMFWARVPALSALLGLGLRWEDYPEEPVPYDGTILHAIERMLPIVATASGGTILLSHVPGVTR
jgi:glycosyltransferase involved in cell wall biosynthesis